MSAPAQVIDAAQVEQESASLVVTATSIVVSCPEEHTRAVEFIRASKAAVDKIEEFFKSLTRPLDEAKKAIVDRRRACLDPLQQGVAQVNGKVLAYLAHERERTRQEEERLRLEQRQKEETERLNRAAELEKAGKREAAEEELAAAPAFVPPIVVPAPPPVKGSWTRTTWKARVLDPNKVPRQFLTPDLKKLEDYANAMRDTAQVEGVEFYKHDGLVTRRS